jgi:hypothetical protein
MNSRPVLQIQARLLADPPLWAVELRDAESGEILWSSWTDDWCAYETLGEAIQRADEIASKLGAPEVARVA